MNLPAAPPCAHVGAKIAPLPRAAIFCLALAAFTSALSLRMTDALLPSFVHDFDISLGNASYVITAFAIAFALSQLVFGPLGDRFGKYLVVASSCMACAFTAALCGLAPSFGLLLAGRVLAGATVGAIIPLSMAWIGDVVPYENRHPVLARFLIGQIVGLSAGVLMGGLAADHFSWRAPFFCAAVLFAAISVMLFSINSRLPAYARTVHRAEGAAVQHMLLGFRQVLARPWARVVLLTVLLEGLFLYGAFTFISLQLHAQYALSLSFASSLVMLFGFGGLLFATSSRILVKHLGESGLTRWGGVLVAVSLLAIAMAPVWWWSIPACLLAGLGFYMLHNTLQINATQMAPERRGAAVSAFSSCFILGQSIGVALAGMLVAPFGTRVILVLGALGVLIVALRFSQLRGKKTLQDALAARASTQHSLEKSG